VQVEEYPIALLWMAAFALSERPFKSFVAAIVAQIIRANTMEMIVTGTECKIERRIGGVVLTLAEGSGLTCIECGNE
jgi:hypothetical protein